MGPVVLDVGDESRHEDDVDRTLTELLEGDMDIPAFRVAGDWNCDLLASREADLPNLHQLPAPMTSHIAEPMRHTCCQSSGWFPALLGEPGPSASRCRLGHVLVLAPATRLLVSINKDDNARPVVININRHNS